MIPPGSVLFDKWKGGGIDLGEQGSEEWRKERPQSRFNVWEEKKKEKSY